MGTAGSRDFIAELVSAATDNDVGRIRNVFQEWERAGTSPPREKHSYPLIHFTPALEAALKAGSLEAADEFFQRGLPPAMDQFGSGAWVALNQGATEATGWNIKTFDFLISRGWNVNYSWGHIGDILAQAVCQNKTPLVKYLLGKGADPNLNPKADFYTPLECAAKFGGPGTEILSMLLAKSPLDEIKCSSTLLYAAEADDIEKMRVLLAAGADIDGIPDNWRLNESHLRDKRFGTALHAAAGYHSIASIKFLLEAGARKDIKNPAGLTPKEVAEELGDKEAADLL